MATLAKKKTKTKAHAAPKLHYNKEALIEEYENTHHLIVKALAAMIGCALVYFFVMMVFVGHTNTSHEDFVKQFGDRVTIEYDGKKLPIYEQGK
jgi:hypothetical protein